jgi:hypothetical protein
MISKIRNLNQKLAIGSMLALAAVSSAFADAADPTTVFDSTTAATTTQVTHYGIGLVTMAGVAVGFLIGVKYVKKIRSAA